MKLTALIIASLCCLSTVFAAEPPPAMEIRLVVPSDTKGAVEKTHEGEAIWVEGIAVFDSHDVKQASASVKGQVGAIVTVKLTDDAAFRLGTYTQDHIRSRLAILSHGKVLLAPVITSAITGGTFEISGNLTLDEGNELAKAIASESTTAAGGKKP